MFMRSRPIALAAALGSLSLAPFAFAHVGIGSGPAFAGGGAVLDFSVGHGCEGADTVAIDVHIPEAVTSVRGVPNTFGVADVQVDDTGAPTHVVWTRDDQARDGDDQYYVMQIRISVPDMPFTKLYFPVTQTCRDAEGNELVTEWAALPGAEPQGGEEEASPAAELIILPARTPGWNRYTVPAEIDDLGTFFGDAQIVWSGDEAFSPNAAVTEMIDDEDGVEVLETIEAGAEIWVKY